MRRRLSQRLTTRDAHAIGSIVLRMRTRRLAEAVEDVDWFLKEHPPGADVEALHSLRATLEEQAR